MPFILTTTGTAKIKCKGNIETLLDYQTVANGGHPQMYELAFAGLFQYCDKLVEAPTLGATALTYWCYAYMFNECTSLISAPSLPSTLLAEGCYCNMFCYCPSLTSAPSLPATALAVECYYWMFAGCSNLETLPALSATTLRTRCYYAMLSGCSKIKLSTTQTGEYQNAFRIPTIGTGTVQNNSLGNMFTDTGGTFTGTPSINTTYYTSNTIIPASGNNN